MRTNSLSVSPISLDDLDSDTYLDMELYLGPVRDPDQLPIPDLDQDLDLDPGLNLDTDLVSDTDQDPDPDLDLDRDGESIRKGGRIICYEEMTCAI